MPHEAPQGTQAVMRAIALLKAFNADRDELTLAELVNITGLNRGTARRLLAALESEALVSRHGSRGTYRLGAGAIALGNQALMGSDLRPLARPILQKLAQQSGETATLEVLIGDQMFILDGVPGRHLICASLDIGTRWPVHLCSTGKAVMALMPESARKRLLRPPLLGNTPKSLTQPAAVEAAITQTQEQGYALCIEEVETDYVAIATAFRGQNGLPEAALCIGGPVSRFSEKHIKGLVPLIKAAAKELQKLRQG